MNWKEYTVAAKRTQPGEPDINYLSISDFGEVGEFLNIVKKSTNHGHDSYWIAQKLIEEAGDVIWYSVAILDYIGGRYNGPRSDFSINIHYEEVLPASRDIGILTGEIIKDIKYLNLGMPKKLHDVNYSKPIKGKIIRLIEAVVCTVYAICVEPGESIEELFELILQKNIDKLLERYPDGFNEESSKNRKEYSDGTTS